MANSEASQGEHNLSDQNEIGLSNRLLDTRKPLSARHKELARLVFLGKKNEEIASTLGLTATRVSVLRSNSMIQAEVERYQDRLFDKTVTERMKDLAPIAASVLEEILTSDDPNIKATAKKDAAIWVLELLHGRPRQQEIAGQNSNVQRELLQEIRSLKVRAQAAPETLTENERERLGLNLSQECKKEDEIEKFVRLFEG